MTEPITDVLSLLRRHEGLRLAAYDDATGQPVVAGDACAGTLTIGYGHTGSDVAPGDIWTKDQAEATLEQDARKAWLVCRSIIGPLLWMELDVVRQAALQDMAFNLGEGGLSKFVHLLDAVRSGAWSVAAHEALSSKWAGQVRQRAADDAHMLLTGEWPA